MDACTEERFLSNVTDHKMEVIRDDGVNRHLRFRRDDSVYYGFDLITWPGHLCVTGDCGTYVFARILDMFKFFRNDPNNIIPSGNKLFINKGYWAEKALSMDKVGEIEKFSQKAFNNAVEYAFQQYFEGYEHQGEDKKAECWDALEEQVYGCCTNEFEAAQAIDSFEHASSGFIFQDFWECNIQDYTFNYLWCLYAIVWGIAQYDGKT